MLTEKRHTGNCVFVLRVLTDRKDAAGVGSDRCGAGQDRW